jgi:PRTRC genetic system protein E
MTMFQELYALATTATLTMIVSADDKTGKMTISVLPKPKKDVGEVALTKDLTLTATPAEFDADFISALQGYKETHASLATQAEATQKVLEAAKAASVKKASDAINKAKASAEKKVTPPAASKGEEQEEDASDASSTSEAENATGQTLSLFG